MPASKFSMCQHMLQPIPRSDGLLELVASMLWIWSQRGPTREAKVETARYTMGAPPLLRQQCHVRGSACSFRSGWSRWV